MSFPWERCPLPGACVLMVSPQQQPRVDGEAGWLAAVSVSLSLCPRGTFDHVIRRLHSRAVPKGPAWALPPFSLEYDPESSGPRIIKLKKELI